MNRPLLKIFLLALLLPASAGAASLRFSGASLQPVEVAPETGTGLDAVYVVNSTSGLSMTFTASSATTTVEVERFDLRGASYPATVDPATISRNGADVTLSTVEGGCGYIFREPSRVSYFWIADYSTAPFTITAINPAPDQDCDRAYLIPSGDAPHMTYTSINGRSYDIDRQITLEYTTLTPDPENVRYNSASTSVSLPYVNGQIGITPPLCDTYFHLSGDRFLRAWNREQQCTSSRFTTSSVETITKATQTSRIADNEVKVETGSLGGSAPVEIEFEAAVTDAAVFTQWLMARDPEMDDIIYRTSDLSFKYTFTEMGTVYVQFQAANASGKCDVSSDQYSVFIGESMLRCPNAFSPGATPGINDEWKVVYKSIVSFECYIFNRWGEKMCEFHDPSQGWDGKYGGKVVPAGVYYYVIKAVGSDGRKYNLSGDINILGYND